MVVAAKHQPRVEVEYRQRRQRVMFGANGSLSVDLRRLAAVHKHAKAAWCDGEAEIQIGLGRYEVVGGDRDGVICREWRRWLRRNLVD